MGHGMAGRALSAAAVSAVIAGATTAPAIAGGPKKATPPGQAQAEKVRKSSPVAAAEGAAAPAKPAKPAKPARPATVVQAPAARTRPAPAPAARRSPSVASRGVASRSASSKQATKRTGSARRGHGRRPKVTLCHATGSNTNPFVEITVAQSAIPNAHDVHQNNEDIIPAGQGDCPRATRARNGGDNGDNGGNAGSRDNGGPAADGAPSAQAPPGERGSLGEVGLEEGDRGTPGAGEPASGPGETSQLLGAEPGDDRLPFTGGDLAAIALAALAALLLGAALRRLSAARSLS